MSREEYAEDMEQRERLAVMRDAPTRLRKEESVKDMVQRERPRLVVMKGAPTKLRKEEFVSNMVQK